MDDDDDQKRALFTAGNPGNVSIGASAPTAKLDVNAFTGDDQWSFRTSYTFTGSSDPNRNREGVQQCL